MRNGKSGNVNIERRIQELKKLNRLRFTIHALRFTAQNE